MLEEKSLTVGVSLLTYSSLSLNKSDVRPSAMYPMESEFEVYNFYLTIIMIKTEHFSPLLSFFRYDIPVSFSKHVMTDDSSSTKLKPL